MTKIEFNRTTPKKIVFLDEDKTIGTLDWGSGELEFTGNASKSAQIFFNYLKTNFDLGSEEVEQ